MKQHMNVPGHGKFKDRSADEGAVNSENRHESSSMNTKLETGGRGHSAHTNNLTGITAFEYVCEGGRG